MNSQMFGNNDDTTSVARARLCQLLAGIIEVNNNLYVPHVFFLCFHS